MSSKRILIYDIKIANIGTAYTCIDNLDYTSFLYDNTLVGMIGFEPITLSDQRKQNLNVCTPIQILHSQIYALSSYYVLLRTV